MKALQVSCGHCGHTTALDPARVPDHPVAYKCPKCQGKIVVDKKKLLAPKTGAHATVQPPAPAAPAPKIEQLALPPGEALPPGFLIAEDEKKGEELAAQLEAHDATLERLTVEAARERALIEPPPLIVYVADTVGTPPYRPLDPIVGLPPQQRRQSFVVLCGKDVATLDGNLAFLYQANLLLSHAHIPKAAGILYSAVRHHHRLYEPFAHAGVLG